MAPRVGWLHTPLHYALVTNLSLLALLLYVLFAASLLPEAEQNQIQKATLTKDPKQPRMQFIDRTLQMDDDSNEKAA